MSVAAAAVSGLIAAIEGNWTRRPALGMGFAQHGGMWSDLVLVSMANAAIVPHLTVGAWLPLALIAGIAASLLVHRHWYRGGASSSGPDTAAPHDRGQPIDRGQTGDSPVGDHADASADYRVDGPTGDRDDGSTGDHDRFAGGHGVDVTGDHMWPERPHGIWWRDLSRAGWAHVCYVAAELTLLLGFALHPMPSAVVIFVAAIVTVHVPIGLLQPRWYLTGHIATVQEEPLLFPCLAAMWLTAALKL